MELKILLLVAAVVIILLPVIYGSKPASQPRRSRMPYRWDGPETDERINAMLAECITLLKGLDVPISNSICPSVRLTGSHSNYGRCCAKGSLKRYTEYDFYIEISGHTLGNTEKSLRNTLIHELIHTVPGGLCHTGEWRKWAKYVSAKTEYNIKSRDGDETDEDYQRLIEQN
jgi:hypothetical protein